MAARGVWANIKPMPNRKRRPVFSAFLYRYRNLVEHFFRKLKQFRAVATRYAPDPSACQGRAVPSSPIGPGSIQSDPSTG